MVRKQVKPKSKRVVAKTLLIMCEGDADEAFIKHVKNLFEVRGGGLRVTPASANGKGARHVVNQAIRHSGAFDTKAVFFDTDTGYDEETKKKIKQNGLIELVCDPCFEALLLDILDQKIRQNESATNLKREWKKFAKLQDGKVASYANAYENLFPKSVIEHAAQNISTLERILSLFKKLP